MKKLWVMLLVAGTFAACNGSAKNGTSNTTSIRATPSPDTTGTANDTSTIKTDSMVKNAPDTLKAH